MLVSDLIRELEAASERFGGMMLAVGTPNGVWKAFDGIDHLSNDELEMEVCSVTFTSGRYDASPVAISELVDLLRAYINELGNMQVVICDESVMHSTIDLNVDKDVGPDGKDVNVAIIQSYVSKPAFAR